MSWQARHLPALPGMLLATAAAQVHEGRGLASGFVIGFLHRSRAGAT